MEEIERVCESEIVRERNVEGKANNFARLVSGAVHRGVEHIPQLRDLAEANMRKSAEGRALLDSGRVAFRLGDGRKGWVEKEEQPSGAAAAEEEQQQQQEQHGSWDAIHVGASATTLHPALVAQLRAPGRMFIPVDDEVGGGQSVWAVDKAADGTVERKRLFAVRYVPLTDGPAS